MSSSAGFKRDGLKCKHQDCGKEFSLFLGTHCTPKELSDRPEYRALQKRAAGFANRPEVIALLG